eukprot:Blabericola_migrator_1__8634@NODE_4526_length_1105_cov_892_128131_g2804_i0_p1_GENE_NODE_4526_length_1105_cov_892_128131_g2804_i0NODE_4526_length_1105_cov_892_128131_g2804_i0_p1_ORF_typecomplete_len226_score47_93DUF4873/PF16170_5/2_9DUF4873/PF16170_5/17Tubulin_C/PF03953_17/0_2_NODE_4526_length_1105_cov_892_128131_g2804_i01678
MIALITTIFLALICASAASNRNFVSDATIVGDCGDTCSSIVNGNVDLTSLIACIATIKERPTCNITYSAPATLVVTNCGYGVKVKVTGLADWILGTQRGSILAANTAVDETSTCLVKVFEGSECDDDTEVIGTLDLKKGSTTKVTLSGQDAVMEAETDEYAVRLTEEYIEGRIIVGVVGGGATTPPAEASTRPAEATTPPGEADGASDLIGIGLMSLIAFYMGSQ